MYFRAFLFNSNSEPFSGGCLVDVAWGSVQLKSSFRSPLDWISLRVTRCESCHLSLSLRLLLHLWPWNTPEIRLTPVTEILNIKILPLPVQDDRDRLSIMAQEKLKTFSAYYRHLWKSISHFRESCEIILNAKLFMS